MKTKRATRAKAHRHSLPKVGEKYRFFIKKDKQEIIGVVEDAKFFFTPHENCPAIQVTVHARNFDLTWADSIVIEYTTNDNRLTITKL